MRTCSTIWLSIIYVPVLAISDPFPSFHLIITRSSPQPSTLHRTPLTLYPIHISTSAPSPGNRVFAISTSQMVSIRDFCDALFLPLPLSLPFISSLHHSPLDFPHRMQFFNPTPSLRLFPYPHFNSETEISCFQHLDNYMVRFESPDVAFTTWELGE